MKKFALLSLFFVSSYSSAFSHPMECPNECCPDVHMPINCSIDPPCPPESACACYPPLPELLNAESHPKFVNKLVDILSDDYIYKPRKGHNCQYVIFRKPFVTDLGLVDCYNNPLHTPMFGYAQKGEVPKYPGKTFVVSSGHPIQVCWKNELVDAVTGKPVPLPTYVPVDETIHIAMPMDPEYPESGVPTVVHLHGGFTEEQSDGFPDAWVTPFGAQKGPAFIKNVFTYSNNQESMMLWYHDHTLGYTRLNNYAGLIGGYVIRDKMENELIKEEKIPSGIYEVPLIIVDKNFTKDGQLFFDYCDQDDAPCAPAPTALPEFFGEFILVNGKVWPYLEVEPRQYRLRPLNGCDSRFLDLAFVKEGHDEPLCFYQIGTDQGFLNKRLKIDHLLMGPGQRADLVFDFSCYEGKTIVLTNSANTPFPDGDPVNPCSTGLVMAFKVTKEATHHCTKVTKKLRKDPIARYTPNAPTRQVLLFESVDQYCRIFPLLGTPSLGGLMWDAPVTETPMQGTTEIWEIYNTTMDAHPIHLHAGNFQILNRQYFAADQDPVTGALSNIQLLGSPMEPLPAEKEGLFDIVNVPPASMDAPEHALGQITRIIMPFTLAGQYVWHCHILSHEDNEMMRPMTVLAPPFKAK